MNPKISIITPIYNAANYLNLAIESVLSQTFKDFELILVDDGSTDNSLDICKYYTLLDSRISYIQQKNQGVAVARQTGIASASGDYIIHLDADDFFLNEALERMYSHALATNSGITIGNYLVSFPNQEPKNCSYEYKILSSEQLINEIFRGQIHGALWNKLIKKELYKNLRFEPGLDFMEDVLILVKISLNYSPDVTFLQGNPIYSYNQRQDSYTNSYTVQYLNKGIKLVNRIEQLLIHYDSYKSLKELNNMKINIVKLYTFYLEEYGYNIDMRLLNIKVYDILTSNYPLHIKILLCSSILKISYPIRFYKKLKSLKK